MPQAQQKQSRSRGAEARHAMYQPSNGSDARVMTATMVAIHSSHTLKLSDLTNRLLDNNAKAGKGFIVDHILGWSILTARFTMRGKAMLSQTRQLQIRQITTYADLI